MASKSKRTAVKKRDYAAIPANALRILACLMDRSAYYRDAAVKVSTIARDLDLCTDEVKFNCQSLCASGFAVLELSGIGVDHKTTAVYIETDTKAIHDHGLTLECRAEQLKGRGAYMKRCARAVAVACHPWNGLAAPALDRTVG